ncbi:hypothetical protein [Syntrophomonas wolfei]|uniref:Uncharacterized protein n=1 Tax=Syntrophomonas wolfei subsp. wolfei (strain DSM 2245B / Goettingen) TaxID=335541 RepID=Q0AYY7_SYNWW|nr:hypothetical protein [Syntrophomonas wolfei]ABI68067.1 hypothetical protein Swol_0745 [Syntrophomonas wolfei subsp. wolfei str. Goettingen G311]
MKLMVGEALEIVTRVQKILQYYQERKVSSVSDMLDDIYLRCCVSEEVKPGNTSVAAKMDKDYIVRVNKPVVKKAVKKKAELSSEEDFLLLQEQLRGLEREQAEELLVSYKIKELCAFADHMSISVLKSGRKAVIAGQICNHYGFRNLNTKMGQRPDMER